MLLARRIFITMDEFDFCVLSALIKKYTNSVLSQGGSRRNLKISLTPKDAALSSYLGRDSFKFIEENDKKLNVLQKKEYITVRRDTNGALQSVDLNISAVAAVIAACGVDNKNAHIKNILAFLRSASTYGFAARFVQAEREYVETKYEWHKSYYADENELALVLKALNAMVLQTNEIMERDFSVKVFGDSKAFACISNKIVAIAKKFDSQLIFEEGDSTEHILQSYNIVKNSTYALVKGSLKFELNGQTIDLNKLGFEYTLSDAMIKKIVFLSFDFKKLITVENLTSFYKLDKKDCLIVYLGGFHNHTKQMLLKKIYDHCGHVEWLHFGDIDAGGFMIFNHLVWATGIPFQPYHMGIEELQVYSNMVKPLTDNDKIRLQKMRGNPEYAAFNEVIDYMLANGIKLEQEALD